MISITLFWLNKGHGLKKQLKIITTATFLKPVCVTFQHLPQNLGTVFIWFVGIVCWTCSMKTWWALDFKMNIASKVFYWSLVWLVAGSRYTLLDLDQPFCHLGVAAFLRGLLSAVGRNHLVSFCICLFKCMNCWMFFLFYSYLFPFRPFLNYQRMYYVFMQMLSSGPAWLSIILLITTCLLPDVVKKVICRALWPTTTERIQVGSNLNRLQCLFDLSSFVNALFWIQDFLKYLCTF